MHKSLPLLLACLCLTSTTLAEQYVSHELIMSEEITSAETKSIVELEQDIQQLKDDYSRASTARFLARHYAQQGNQQGLKKAEEYYELALKGDGLSVFAKREMLAELAELYFYFEQYQNLIQTVQRYQTLRNDDGKTVTLSAALHLKLALSHMYLQQMSTALKLANDLFKQVAQLKVSLNLSELNQLLYIFYNNHDYLNSIRVQKWIINKDSFNPDHWVRLSQIQQVSNDNHGAAETLLTAYQQGLALPAESLLLMCQLLAKNGNPYMAARLLQQAMDQQQLEHNLEHMQQQFTYWYMAQELELASASLLKVSQLSDDASHKLDLAELYYRLQHWQKMNQLMKLTCDEPLDNQLVGRASLLLGISHFKLNQLDDAIEAFQDASIVGGNQQAISYLNYLKVEREDPRKRRRFKGPCQPKDRL